MWTSRTGGEGENSVL